MKQNIAYDDLYAARVLRDLAEEPTPSPWLGLVILGLYGLLLGLFGWWALN